MRYTKDFLHTHALIPVEQIFVGVIMKKNRQLLSRDFPESIAPQLATAIASAPPSQWRYEIKYDGYRMLARIGNGVSLFTRNGFDWTARMPVLRRDLDVIEDCVWLDGEVIMQDASGRPAFEAVQEAFQTGATDDLVYIAFDIMYLGDRDLRNAPLEERRTILASLTNGHAFERVRLSETIEADPVVLLEHACNMRLEGIIGKRPGSRYTSRRSGDWIKVKCDNRQEFVIAGYTRGSAGFGSLVIGLYSEDEKLIYAGRVRAGLDERAIARLRPLFASLKTDTPAFVPVPASLAKEQVNWVKPQLVCEVKYTDITAT